MRADILRGLAVATLLAGASTVLAHDDDLRFVRSTLVCKKYDGTTDDLLTAGLGKTGLGSSAAPTVADPLKPTADDGQRPADPAAPYGEQSHPVQERHAARA